jgi:dephospho-CoA kinase
MSDGVTALDSQRPFVIGVTGNIACGKSTVMRCLGDHGVELIDADRVYHELIAPGFPLWQALQDRFGPGIVSADRSIDRRALGGIVFSDPAALADLDRITHPAVIEATRERIAQATTRYVAIDAVKLIESGMTSHCDAVWLVVCEREQQISRLMARNGLIRPEAERRVDAQPSAELKRNVVDTVIDNGGSIDETCRQVVAALSKLPI